MYLKIKERGTQKRVPKVNSLKKYIELNNKTFVVKKVKGELHSLEYKTLTDCYKKPSDIKRSIWRQWGSWLLQVDKKVDRNVTNMWFGSLVVVSYNCMMFTLGCNVYNNDFKLIGYLYITKTRQELWLA